MTSAAPASGEPSVANSQQNLSESSTTEARAPTRSRTSFTRAPGYAAADSVTDSTMLAAMESSCIDTVSFCKILRAAPALAVDGRTATGRAKM